MCPMCEKRAQLLLQQQQLDGTGKPSGIPPKSSSLFRNPFKSCKNFTHQCCSPVCESQRTSIHSVRRSSVRPSLTPDHSGEITPEDYRILESPLTPDPKEQPGAKPEIVLRRPRSFLTRLKLLTQGPVATQGESGDKVIAAADVAPTVIVAETPTSEGGSMNMTETNVSESTMVSMRNLNGSSFRGSTLKSSAYDDDASTFAIIPRTSMNSQDLSSDASGLSDRFGELDIGYLSLEESGEGPDIDDTVSISSQCEDLDPTDIVSESDLEQDYSIQTDSQEWCTDDTASVLHWSRGHISKNHLHLHLPDLETTPPHELTASPPHRMSLPRQDSLTPETVEETPAPEPTESSSSSATLCCSRCGRKENKVDGQTTKSKRNAFLDKDAQAVMAAKVVMLLGKYGNRKGLRVAGLPVPAPPPELYRLRNMLSPNSTAVSAFQNEVARMMLEGVDVPGLNMDVEQFLAGYMKLNSPFYIDLIEDFFKSVCVDCFGHMEEVRGSDRQRPAYTVLKPKRPGNIKSKR